MDFGLWTLFIFATLTGSIAYAGGKVGPPVVRIQAETVTRSDRLTLGDLAEVRSDDPAAVERLRSIALGYSPSVGAVRELSRDRIFLAIAAAGFPDGSVRVESPAIVIVRRAAQTVDPALVRAAVERATLTGLQNDGATARLTRLDLPPVIQVPSGMIEARASAGGVRDLFAPFVASIELWVDGRVVRRLSATTQVEAFAPVIVAARDLPAHARVREDEVKIENRRLERPASLYITEVKRLRGFAVRRAMIRGEAITTDQLDAEMLVKPGDPVRVVGESGALHVAVAGEARAAGRIGDRIQVKNVQSGTLLQAIVVDEGLVRVRF